MDPQLRALEDIKSFCSGRMEINNHLRPAYRDVKGLVLQHIRAIKFNRSDVPCGDCGHFLLKDMSCDNPECIRSQR